MPPKPSKSKIIFPYSKDFFDDELPNGVLSPSGIGTWRSCQKKYYYSYVLGIRSPFGIAAAKGRAIHSGADKVHKHTIETGKPLPRDEAIAHVAEEFDKELVEVPTELQTPDGIPVGVTKDRTLNNFGVFYSSAIPLMDPIAAEKPFAVKIGGVPIRGIIDLIDSQTGEYSLTDDPSLPPSKVEVVADLKTTKKRWSEQQVLYAVAMTIYAIAVGVEHIRIDLLLDQKKGCQYTALQAVRSVHEKNIVEEDIAKISESIKYGNFPRCDPTGWVCSEKWCGYYDTCRGPK